MTSCKSAIVASKENGPYTHQSGLADYASNPPPLPGRFARSIKYLSMRKIKSQKPMLEFKAQRL